MITLTIAAQLEQINTAYANCSELAGTKVKIVLTNLPNIQQSIVSSRCFDCARYPRLATFILLFECDNKNIMSFNASCQLPFGTAQQVSTISLAIQSGSSSFFNSLVYYFLFSKCTSKYYIYFKVDHIYYIYITQSRKNYWTDNLNCPQRWCII